MYEGILTEETSIECFNYQLTQLRTHFLDSGKMIKPQTDEEITDRCKKLR
jgi:hypothetical protein